MGDLVKQDIFISQPLMVLVGHDETVKVEPIAKAGRSGKRVKTCHCRFDEMPNNRINPIQVLHVNLCMYIVLLTL